MLPVWVTYRELLGQFDDHALQVVCEALELLVGGLEEVRAPPGQQAESSPAVVGVPHHPAESTRGGGERTTSQRVWLAMEDFRDTVTVLDVLVLFLHHVDGVGLFDGFLEELLQGWHKLPAGRRGSITGSYTQGHL